MAKKNNKKYTSEDVFMTSFVSVIFVAMAVVIIIFLKVSYEDWMREIVSDETTSVMQEYVVQQSNEV